MEHHDFLQELAEGLISLPDPTYWFDELGEIRRQLGKSEGDTAALLAKRIWLKKVCSTYYPLHPDVKREIEYKRFFLDSEDNLLLWATLIAQIDGDDADLRYKRCQSEVERKYGAHSWKRVYCASKKISRVLTGRDVNCPSSLSIMATQSVAVRGWVFDERLSKLPKSV